MYIYIQHTKILEAVHPDWTKYAQAMFLNTLFREDFQSTLSANVEKDNVHAKALAITSKAKDRSNGC